MNQTSYLFRWVRCVLLMGTMVLCFSTGALAQQEIEHPLAVPYADILTSKMQKPFDANTSTEAERAELQRIQRSSDHTQAKIRNGINLVCILFLFGAFCAIWAQNTARNPLLWFAVGACFNLVTVAIILRKNAKTHRRKKRYRRNSASYVDFAQFY